MSIDDKLRLLGSLIHNNITDYAAVNFGAVRLANDEQYPWKEFATVRGNKITINNTDEYIVHLLRIDPGPVMTVAETANPTYQQTLYLGDKTVDAALAHEGL